MASLIDLLIDDLNNEDTGYNKLLDLSNDKTSAIVKEMLMNYKRYSYRNRS